MFKRLNQESISIYFIEIYELIILYKYDFSDIRQNAKYNRLRYKS